MVFHCSLSDSKSPQVSRTRLRILAVLIIIIIIIIIFRKTDNTFVRINFFLFFFLIKTSR